MLCRNVAILAFEGVLALDISGPAEVLGMAARRGGSLGGYKVHILSVKGGPIETASGIIIQTRALSAFGGKIDTLIVAGGIGTETRTSDDAMVRWVVARSPRVRRICSVCTGAFILAEAGLLDGRRAVTHWDARAQFKQKYPRVNLDLDPIYIKDGCIWTSAGVTAGIDLALALVEDDYSRAVALAIAKLLVVFLHRPGGQAQFSTALSAQALAAQPSHKKFADLHAWMADHVSSDLSLDSLADWSRMAKRSFTRAYRKAMGITPARAVEQIRLEAAKQALEKGGVSVKQIATTCGFGDEERLRRAFLRQFGVAPSAYRQRFSS